MGVRSSQVSEQITSFVAILCLLRGESYRDLFAWYLVQLYFIYIYCSGS